MSIKYEIQLCDVYILIRLGIYFSYSNQVSFT